MCSGPHRRGRAAEKVLDESQVIGWALQIKCINPDLQVDFGGGKRQCVTSGTHVGSYNHQHNKDPQQLHHLQTSLCHPITVTPSSPLLTPAIATRVSFQERHVHGVIHSAVF